MAALTAPLPESPRPRFRLSVERYERMVAAGILDENDRVELLDGEIVEKMAIGPLHCSRLNRLTKAFYAGLADRAAIRVQDPVRLPGSVPEPDLALAKPRADDYAKSLPTQADLLLVVEVADSSLEEDRGFKSRLYAAAGVPEYWVVDLPGGCVWVCRGPQPDGAWATVEAQRPGAALAPLAFPELALDLAALLT